MNDPTFAITERGFGYMEFTDRYGESCSLQESSLAEEAAVWLGMDKGTHHEGSCMARMHLTEPLVVMLIERLRQWLATGLIREPNDAPDGSTYFRVDSANPAHVYLSLFMGGGHAGTICIRRDEFAELRASWGGGWRNLDRIK